ncbi:thiol peroxidase [Micromonospora chersina]|uniref:thiol peroxidase n=1 Tax=Micromonospora chersina TaxID=47854 RepID=UPI003410A928
MSSVPQRDGVTSLQGRPVTLLGDEITVGAAAPDFTVVANDFSPVTLASSAGTVRILSAVPSLDTEVCEQQTRRFNEMTAGLDGVTVLTISADLPFTQRRWCEAAGLPHVQTASDHRDLSFGLAYGVAIAGLRLLARAVFVVDRDDRVVYAEYVPEIGQHPNYEAALKAATAAR